MFPSSFRNNGACCPNVVSKIVLFCYLHFLSVNTSFAFTAAPISGIQGTPGVIPKTSSATFGSPRYRHRQCCSARRFGPLSRTRVVVDPQTPTTNKRFVRTNSRLPATVSPFDGENSIVGVVGTGYVPILTCKLSCLAGYDTWMLIPEGDEEKIEGLILDGIHDDAIRSRVEFVPSTDQPAVEDKLAATNALICAVDGDSVLDPNVVDFLLDPTRCGDTMRRVVAMSRNLNGAGLGFFSKAAKTAANPEVWVCDPPELVRRYRTFEDQVMSKAKECGADYTIVRAGTLKGGACGDASSGAADSSDSSEGESDQGASSSPSFYPQYLTSKYYELTKRDILSWQLLFDCRVRGVELSGGDTMAGPGATAVFAATSPDECAGDTSRCGIAEAMVRSLALDRAANVDFGVGTKARRIPPDDGEWEKLFHDALS